MKHKDYDENYYERGVQLGISGYTNYRWMPDLTIPMCKALINHVGLKPGAKVLDFGCAKGFLVKALRMLDIDAIGADVSEYALSHCDRDLAEYLLLINDVAEIQKRAQPYEVNKNGKFDCIIAKDVLEHLTKDEIIKTFLEFNKISEKVFIAVPVGRNGKYVIPEYELDKTHIIREDIDWWFAQLQFAHFTRVQYSYRVPGIKDNWSHYEHGNLFITAFPDEVNP